MERDVANAVAGKCPRCGRRALIYERPIVDKKILSYRAKCDDPQCGWHGRELWNLHFDTMLEEVPEVPPEQVTSLDAVAQGLKNLPRTNFTALVRTLNPDIINALVDAMVAIDRLPKLGRKQ